MILTTKARYAVMAIIEISSQKTNKPLSLNEIARSQNISLSYLEQIFTHLKKNDIVKSVLDEVFEMYHKQGYRTQWCWRYGSSSYADCFDIIWR